MKPFLVVSTFLTVTVALYAIPTGLEYVLEKQHISPWVSVVLLGDLAGCAFLYALGFRTLALKIYAVSTLVKAAIVAATGSRSPLLWISDIVPALVAATVVSRAVIRMLVTLPRDFNSGF